VAECGYTGSQDPIQQYLKGRRLDRRDTFVPVALPTGRTEAVLHGMAEAFAFFGCVPVEVWWDNPATVATHIGRGRERVMHPRYVALAGHYTSAPKFCLPATPREKPRMENRVKDRERMWATPVPRVNDLGELNAHLRRCRLAARERTCGSNADTVGTRFARDRAANSPKWELAGRAVILVGLLRGELRAGRIRPEPWPEVEPTPPITEDEFDKQNATYP
jgi:hypothetical protein